MNVNFIIIKVRPSVSASLAALAMNQAESKAAKLSYDAVSAKMEQENTSATNKTESKAEDCSSPPKMHDLRGTPRSDKFLREHCPVNGEWPSPCFFANESNWPPSGSLIEPPCKNDPRRFSGEYIPSPDRRTAAGKKRSLSFNEPDPPPYTFDDHMLNKDMNDSP